MSERTITFEYILRYFDLWNNATDLQFKHISEVSRFIYIDSTMEKSILRYGFIVLRCENVTSIAVKLSKQENE